MSSSFHPSEEILHPPSEMPSQFSVDHQVLQNLWTQPPQPVPGPDNHPFFNMFAPNAYGSLLQPDIVDNAPETHTGADAGNDPEEPAFQMPLVYPFIPAPSISMEPMTPENNRATLSDQTPPASVSQLSTPSLSFSDDHDSSPDSRPSSAKRTVGSGPVEFGDSNLKEEEEETTPPPAATSITPTPTQDDPDKTKVEAICILTYMRAFPNSETSQPAVIADGQIWRSPDKKKGWRRNQWVIDVR